MSGDDERAVHPGVFVSGDRTVEVVFASLKSDGHAGGAVRDGGCLAELFLAVLDVQIVLEGRAVKKTILIVPACARTTFWL
jgi:hypothetical protein